VKLELVLDEGELAFGPAPEVLERIRSLVAHCGPADFTLQVVLTGDETLHHHNREFRGVDRPTDVLSFSYFQGHEDHRTALLLGEADGHRFLEFEHPQDEPLAGQILVSLETLAARGPVHAQNLDDELAFMTVHGLLHVLGFDHTSDAEAAEMQAQERRLMSRYAGLSAREEGV
jgi:probable rRNA maturation factor